MQPFRKLARTLAAALLLPACGDGEGGGDPFAGTFPEPDHYALTVEDGDGQSLAVATGALVGEPSGWRTLARDALGRIGDQVRGSLEAIRETFADADPEAVSEGNRTCRRWEAEREGRAWRLTACERDGRVDRSAWRVETLEGETWRTAAAGEHARLDRESDRARAAGRLGLDLDALRPLTGDTASGRLGVGYRAAGRMRQVEIGLAAVQLAGWDAPIDARWRYRNILGVGGRIALLTRGDVLARGEGGALAEGRDGQTERVRLAVGWNRGRGARAALTACGGTVGESCVHLVQCWGADGRVAHHEDLGEATDDGRPSGERRDGDWPGACPAVSVSIDGPPDEAEVSPVPGQDPEQPGPPVQEPAAADGE